MQEALRLQEMEYRMWGIRVVSETQCIKDEIFAYMAESARRDCGVPESATVFW